MAEAIWGKRIMNRIVAALAVVGLLAAAPSVALAAKASASAYKAPRGPDGKHPDLNGVWQAMNSAGWDIEPHAARGARKQVGQ